MSRFLAALDERVVPPVAGVAAAAVARARRVFRWAPVDTLRVAISDTGLLGPAVLAVLFAACLIAATGGDAVGH